MPTTLFSFGYYGWGNHTADLVRAVDAVESGRGFAPPLFVDTRIRRSVRAAGFTRNTFGKLLGARHEWMPRLGNRYIVTRTGSKIQIDDPRAVGELLDRALADPDRRVLFFCSCQWPGFQGEINCHRVAVGRLALAEARRRGQVVEVIEWPGGEPRRIELDVPARNLKAVRAERVSIPLEPGFDLAALAGLPWASTVTLRSGGEECTVLTGPAAKQPPGWVLPVLGRESSPASQAGFRREFGLDPLRTG